MSNRVAEIRKTTYKEIEKFRKKRAVTPENALTMEKLELSSEFKTFLNTSPRLLGDISEKIEKLNKKLGVEFFGKNCS